MRYPVDSPSEWASYRRLPLGKRIHLFKRSFDHLRRHYAKLRNSREIRLEPISRSLGFLSPNEPILICVVRNGEATLPSLLAHYRRMGLKRFAFVDDASTDHTPEILLDAVDVDLYRSNVGYAQAVSGLIWRTLLVNEYGRRRWFVSVDADEYLVFPGFENRTIDSFIGDLKRARLTRATATMLDLYPDGPLSEAPAYLQSDAPPTDSSPLFDGDGYIVRQEEFCTSVYGSPRSRVFGVRTLLTKFPVLYVDWQTRFSERTSHGVLPLWRNFSSIHSVLLHHKFGAGTVARFTEAAARGAHYAGARYYKEIVGNEAFGDATDLRYAGSVRFRDSEQLVRNGYMQDLSKGEYRQGSTPALRNS